MLNAGQAWWVDWGYSTSELPVGSVWSSTDCGCGCAGQAWFDSLRFAGLWWKCRHSGLRRILFSKWKCGKLCCMLVEHCRSCSKWGYVSDRCDWREFVSENDICFGRNFPSLSQPLVLKFLGLLEIFLRYQSVLLT